MITWIVMLIVNLLIPALMILFGAIFSRKAPKEINWFYGYRTSRSMMNMDTWVFAHKHIGRICFKLGWVLLILSVAAMLVFIGWEDQTAAIANLVVCGLQCVVLCVPIVFTEKALKENFDSEGKRHDGG